MTFNAIRTRYAVFSLSFFGCGSVLPIILLFFDESRITGMILLPLFLCTGYYMIDAFMFRKMHICSKGVTYTSLRKRYFMKWSDIEMIGICYIPTRAPGRPPCIYITADQIPTSRAINERYFLIHYRKDVEQAIRMYWDKDIWGIGSVSDS